MLSEMDRDEPNTDIDDQKKRPRTDDHLSSSTDRSDSPKKTRPGWDEKVSSVESSNLSQSIYYPPPSHSHYPVSNNKTQYFSHLVPLTEEQQKKLQMAKDYSAEQTKLLLQAKAREVINQITTIATPSPTSATGTSSIDPRNYSILSRIYVGSINFELTEEPIRVVFSQFGSVKNISMSIDPLTKKHKGFCFIEFDTPEAAALATEVMNGTDFAGRQLKVGRPNNYASALASGFIEAPKKRIYISNVNEFVTERNILSIFEAFGKVEKCILTPDLLKLKHKGFGFIEFEEDQSAINAVASMNNFELGGLPLHVCHALVDTELGEGMKELEAAASKKSAVPPPSAALNAANAINDSLSRNAAAQEVVNKLNAVIHNNRPEKTAEEVATLEDSMSISATQRFAIMQKLARIDEKPKTDSSSNVILLKNMVNLEDADEDLADEVCEECSKHGSVSKVIIWIHTADGGYEWSRQRVSEGGSVWIFVEFDKEQSADIACQSLDRRWFAGHQITATLYPLEKFRQRDFSG